MDKLVQLSRYGYVVAVATSPQVSKTHDFGYVQASHARSRTQLKKAMKLNKSALKPFKRVVMGDPRRIEKNTMCSPNLGICVEA